MFQINENTISEMLAGIRSICMKYKNRSAGTVSERQCQEFFQEECNKWSDKTELEEFPLHPNAFMGWLRLAAIMELIAITFFWISWLSDSIVFPILAAVFVTFSVLMGIFEFLLYRRFVDFLFPKAISVNLIARRLPQKEIKRRIIFGGHADAAHEWTYALHGQIGAILPVMIGTITAMLFVLGCDAALLIQRLHTGSLVLSAAWRTIGIIQLLCVLSFIAISFFVNWNVVADGANDNLTGCYVAMSVLKELAANDIRFEHTEVCCLITGGEESGLRGSLAYAQRHKKELSEVETIFVALDTLRETDKLQVYTIGQTGMQRNSKEVAALLVNAGEKCGLTITQAKLYPGATDAESFSRYGHLACGLCGVDHNPQFYYHTRKDTWDNVDADCLRNSLKICMEAVYLFDENGVLN